MIDKALVLIVVPGQKPIEKRIELTEESFQKVVGGSVDVQYPFPEMVALIYNRDAKKQKLDYNRALRDEFGHVYDIIAGTFMIVGLGDDEFISLSSDLVEMFFKKFESPDMFIPFMGALKVVPMDS